LKLYTSYKIISINLKLIYVYLTQLLYKLNIRPMYKMNVDEETFSEKI